MILSPAELKRLAIQTNKFSMMDDSTTGTGCPRHGSEVSGEEIHMTILYHLDILDCIL